MPIVDFDGNPVPEITDYDKSKTQLHRNLNKFTDVEFIDFGYSRLDTNFLPRINDYHKSTRSGIESFMYNKIRMALDAIMKKHGFPMRFHHTVNFLDLLMVSIPFFTQIAITDTLDAWDDNIEKIGMRHNWLLNPSIRNILDKSDGAWWFCRAIIIYDVPDEYARMIMRGIPTNIDEAIWESAMRLTMRPYSMFDNIISFGGINNLVILANWNKVREMIDKYGK